MKKYDLDVWTVYQSELNKNYIEGQSGMWTELHPRITNLVNMLPREMIKNQRSQVHAAACLYLDYCIERKEDAGKADFRSDVYFWLCKKVLYVLFHLENSHSLLIAYGPEAGKAAYRESGETKKDQAETMNCESVWSKERIQFFRQNGMEVKISAELLCHEIEALISAMIKNQ
ncbi:MAG: hypothetical protein IKH57_04070 [Clostridia bacterium]|nr:hypothetical protein [Clostridia bacterium]